jgi:hypothetical protein
MGVEGQILTLTETAMLTGVAFQTMGMAQRMEGMGAKQKGRKGKKQKQPMLTFP